ncbi:acyltransferase [Paenibacillus agricola]|uniref:Acyltransferase n=1 Tax=Paenibacillus agricola TaxID=2716264 RepID=A0ABX0IXI7_9BACL|nr:acyltransferase [Paenibacillus agricola]NHN28562.1 acyltransferase [Paenibacillus agricola]
MSIKKSKQPRIAELQLLRGFAFLAVVLQHAIGHYAYLPEASLGDGIVLALFLLAAKFAVPMFIFITGFVLFYNYRDGVQLVDFWLKRCKDIVLPYIMWSILYVFVFDNQGVTLWNEIVKLPTYLTTGTAMYHLWYVVMVVPFYFIFPLLQQVVRWILNVCTQRQIYLGLWVLVFAYMMLIALQPSIANAFIAWNIPVLTPLFAEYSDRNTIFFFLYFVIGMVAGLNLPSWKQFLEKWTIGVISLYALTTCVLLYRIITHFYSNGSFKIHYNDTLLLQPLMAVFLVFSIMVMYIIAIKFYERANPKCQFWLNYIGHYSYGAYLAHALMLVAAVYITDLCLPGWNATIRTIISFAICTVLSIAAARWLSSFKWIRFMTGTTVLQRK